MGGQGEFLAKKPESFDNIADIFKLSLNQMEERFTGLEATISSLQEKLEKAEPEDLAPLEQRIEDIEDLIMVEQAGVIELQKMLAGVDQKFNELASGAPTQELQDRIRTLDSRVKSLSETVSKTLPEIQRNLNRTENDVRYLSQMPPQAEIESDNIENRLVEMKVHFSSVKDYTEEAIKNMNRKISQLSEIVNRPRADFDFINSKFSSLKSGIDMLSDKKIEIDMKVAKLDEKVNVLSDRLKEVLTDKFVDEIEDNKRSIVTTNARLESVERVIKNLNKNLAEVENSAKKFEGFEKLTMLNKNVDKKMQDFKIVEEEVKRLSNHVEMMYENLDRRLSKVKEAEERIDGLKKDLEGVKDVIDKTRVDIMSRVKKEDLDKRLQEIVGSIKANTQPFIESARKIGNRIQSLEDVQTKTFKQMGELQKETSAIATRPREKPARVEIPKGIENIDDIYMSLSDIESRTADMERKIANIEEPSGLIEAQTMELIDRFVFLESRLAAIEASMRRTASNQPIILE